MDLKDKVIKSLEDNFDYDFSSECWTDDELTNMYRIIASTKDILSVNTVFLKKVFIVIFSSMGSIRIEEGHILESEKIAAFHSIESPFLFTKDNGVTFEKLQYSVRVFSCKHKAEKHLKFRLESAINSEEKAIKRRRNKINEMDSELRELTLSMMNNKIELTS